jgi:hypothetical protein
MQLAGLALVLSLLVPAPSDAEPKRPAEGGKGERVGALYRWVDERGVVHYSEALPQEQTHDTTELNKQGRVVRQLDGVQTPEMRRAASERLELERLEKQKAFEQKRRDEALLNTYTEEREIDDARDRNIEIPAQAIKGLEHRLQKVREILAESLRHEDDYARRGEEAPENLDEEIQDKKREIARIEYDIKRYQEQMLAIRVKYNGDKLRFRELKGLATPASPSKS